MASLAHPIDLSAPTTVLVDQRAAASKNCNVKPAEPSAWYDVFADDPTPQDIKDDEDIRLEWCRIRATIDGELNRRRRVDAEAVRQAEVDAKNERIATWGKDLLAEPVPVVPNESAPVAAAGQIVDDVSDSVSGAARATKSFLDMLNPLYWARKAYGAATDSVGLGDSQSVGDRLAGMFRMIILLGAGLTGFYLLVQALKAGLGYGMETQKNVIAAAPQLAKLATVL